MNTTRDAEQLESESVPVTHDSLIRMENLIQLESQRLQQNQNDLAKLRQLAESAEQTTLDSIEGNGFEVFNYLDSFLMDF